MNSTRTLGLLLAVAAAAALLIILLPEKNSPSHISPEPAAPSEGRAAPTDPHAATVVATSTASGCVTPRTIDCGQGPWPKTGDLTRDLEKQARFVPSFREGKAAGFKLFGIRPNSVYQHIGLANGDRIVRVNGTLLRSPDVVLEVFEQLRCAEAFSMEVVRDERTIDYRCQLGRTMNR